MFEAAVSKFVKAVGQHSLLAVPNLDEADQCRPFQVVVKKNRRWPWQSAKYEVTPFKLNQLLTNQSDLKDCCPVTSRDLTNYVKTYAFSLDGKIGGKLKSLLDADISGDDKVNVEAQFGDVIKDEVDEPDLMNLLQSRQLDIKHDFVQQVCQNSRKVLCVIVGSARLAADGKVHIKTDVDGDEKVDADGTLAKDIVSPEEDAKVDDANEKTLTILKDTPLAYNICELYVKEAGALELIIEKDASGGFESTSEPDKNEAVVSKGDKEISPSEMFSALYGMCEKDRNQLNKHVLSLCTSPSQVEYAFLLLKHASRAKEDASEKLAASKKQQDMKAVLLQAGFTAEGDMVSYHYGKSEIFESLLYLFEALMELDDDETIALAACTGSLSTQVLQLLTNALNDKKIKSNNKKIAALFENPSPEQEWMLSLGFQVVDGDVVSLDDNDRELEGALRVVYGLWGNAALTKKSAGKCALL